MKLNPFWKGIMKHDWQMTKIRKWTASRFTKFNVLYLGCLFFALLFLAALSHSARPPFGSSFIWTTKYLDGMVIAAVYLSLLLLAVLSWCFSLWKTWKLTKSDSVINRTRLLAFGWLLGAPVFIFFTAIYWVSAMRLITDFLVTVVWVWELYSSYFTW